MIKNVYVYILIMGAVTYLVRMLPLTLIRREIKNKYVKSFLHYLPYVTLSVMTFPAILSATSSIWSALAGLVAAVVIAYKDGNLFKVSLGACAVVFIAELIV